MDVDATLIEILVLAPLAPFLGVLMFWFFQLFFIECKKYFFMKIKTRHEVFYRFTNLLGVLFQSLCQVLGYTVTRSGVAHVSLSVSEGKIEPKKEKSGVFEWVSNVFLFLGPFFLPSMLLLACLVFLIPKSFMVAEPLSVGVTLFYTLSNQLMVFGVSLYHFSVGLFVFLGSMDFFDPMHLGFFLLFIFLGLGIRPSYLGEEQRRRVSLVSDLKNIWNHLVGRLLYVVVFFVLLYVFFSVSFFVQVNWYVAVFSFFGWLSILAMAAIGVALLVLCLLRLTDRLVFPWSKFPYVVLLVSYLFPRLVFVWFPIPYFTSVSLLIMVVSTLVVTMVLLCFKTNRFKTKTKMKPLRVEDGPG